MSKILITLIAVLFGFQTTQAQNGIISDTVKLDEIVVTAAKISQTERQTTRPIVVINRQQIEQSLGKDLSQLLNEQSGVSINGAFSNPGKDKAVYLQGAATQYTLILVDGIPVNDPSSVGGAFDLRLFSLSNVERIEIVKGSMSTLYGSDAIAGVINIITKTASENTFQVDGQASYGSFNSFNGALGVNGRTGIFVYNVNFNRESSDGISEAQDLGNNNFDKDGFSRNALTSNFLIQPSDNFKITPFLNISKFGGDYDGGSFQDGPETFDGELFNPGVQLRYGIEDFVLNARYNFTDTYRIFRSAFGDFQYSGKQHNADVFLTEEVIPKLNALVGLSYQHFEFDDFANPNGFPTSQLTSPYLSLFLENIGNLNAEVGFRVNNHSEYGTNTTFNFSPAYNFSEQFRVLASVSSGFKAPTLSELFGPFGANENLLPQESISLDFGTEFYSLDGRVKLEAHYFTREVENQIIFFNGGYDNVSEQSDFGLELSGSMIVSNQISLNAFYNFVDGEQTINNTDGSQTTNSGLIRRPKHKSGLGINLNLLKNLKLNLNTIYAGKTTDLFFDNTTFTQSEVDLDSYVLLNAYAEYGFLSNQLSAFLDLKNITNAEYTEVYGFNTIGFAAKAGIRFTF